MENIVKQIQLLALVIILGATVIAFGIEIYQMIEVRKVTLADLLLLFLYLEVLAMVRVFLGESINSNYIAIVYCYNSTC